jgi:uncharacterized protein (DUF1015 family)
MAEIRPFKGIRYSPKQISDLAAVICPPYDIISPQQQDALYQRNEFNFVRIEFNRELPQDTPQDNRYTRACQNISQWLRQGVLKKDKTPSLYIHEHQFTWNGQSYQRQNIITCVRLEEWDQKVIRPHENIIPKAKSDRLSMLYNCECNTSPVLGMYADPDKIISSIIKSQEKKEPLINTPDDFGDHHKVWAVTSPSLIQQIQEKMAAQPLYIADGHHRYDSALTYRRERASQVNTITGEEGFNFVMMSLVDFEDPGLIILPPHRLVRGIGKSTFGNLKSQLKEFFAIEELSMNLPDIWSRVDQRLTGMKPEMTEVRLGVFGLEGDKLYILTLRNFESTNQLMPAFHGDLYNKLDVSLVDHVILEKLLAFDKAKEEISLAYSSDRVEAVNRVKDQQYQLVFILNPVQPEIIRSIADTGDRMPRKSTYFYPKSPAGLVFYRW